MPREFEISNNEKQFILEALNENLRLDGRALDSFRKAELKFGDDYGLADLKIGKTRVVTRISCEVVAPYPDRKHEGIFTISCEFSPMASPAFEVGRQNEGEMILARILEKAMRRSSALDTESLCIIAGSKCFSLRADIHILSHDGNLIDASCMSLLAALQHFRRPEVTVEGEDVTLYDVTEREPVPLALLHHPLCITFSYYASGRISLVDATAAEEQVREGEVIITMNRHGELCQIAKYGGVPVEGVTLLQWTSLALMKVQELHKFIQAKLDEDNKKRDVGGLMSELRAENDR